MCPWSAFSQARPIPSKKQVREHSVWIDPDDAADFDKAIAQFEKYVPDSADLKEPLARVEQALREAMGQAA